MCLAAQGNRTPDHHLLTLATNTEPRRLWGEGGRYVVVEEERERGREGRTGRGRKERNETGKEEGDREGGRESVKKSIAV